MTGFFIWMSIILLLIITFIFTTIEHKSKDIVKKKVPPLPLIHEDDIIEEEDPSLIYEDDIIEKEIPSLIYEDDIIEKEIHADDASFKDTEWLIKELNIQKSDDEKWDAFVIYVVGLMKFIAFIIIIILFIIIFMEVYKYYYHCYYPCFHGIPFKFTHPKYINFYYPYQYYVIRSLSAGRRKKTYNKCYRFLHSSFLKFFFFKCLRSKRYKNYWHYRGQVVFWRETIIYYRFDWWTLKSFFKPYILIKSIFVVLVYFAFFCILCQIIYIFFNIFDKTLKKILNYFHDKKNKV